MGFLDPLLHCNKFAPKPVSWFKPKRIVIIHVYFKVVSTIFLLICLSRLKRKFGKLGKIFFISLQNLFLFMKKANFSILVIYILWHHQVPNHTTRNQFYWKMWEVNTVCEWNLASLCHITKENIYQKNLQKLRPENLFRQFCVCKEFSRTSIGKWHFWS